ncbi:hypothetical protein I314_04339 [Cryptococcus bacillisporus CA1873]|uniref:Uncharacterized protein n=1 Tax=Cryptococcus bacillisporus CA1873 TaxID=1296111 RepID=A0ABR5B8J1_CRYGA|nr:hypothetical protein I314_04339 [Cryptococcus bacillisporus CA1873]|eukprot:KIR59904.1 hypothetical protein I314_04339 [Cryptococcus gattii CA1873]
MLSFEDENEEFDEEAIASACQGSDKQTQRALEVNAFHRTITSMIKDFELQHQVSFVIIKASAHHMDSDEWTASPQAMLALTSLRKVTEMHNLSIAIGIMLKANQTVNGTLLKRKRDETALESKRLKVTRRLTESFNEARKNAFLMRGLPEPDPRQRCSWDLNIQRKLRVQLVINDGCGVDLSLLSKKRPKSEGECDLCLKAIEDGDLYFAPLPLPPGRPGEGCSSDVLGEASAATAVEVETLGSRHARREEDDDGEGDGDNNGNGND